MNTQAQKADAPGAGSKLDAGKVGLDLVPFESVIEIAKVLDFGAKKYAAHNWRKGMRWSRLVGAALRHLFDWARGIDKDPETGLSHLAHAGCCILFLLSYELTTNGEDDRYRAPAALPRVEPIPYESGPSENRFACDREQPVGWRCTRAQHDGGPCALLPVKPIPKESGSLVKPISEMHHG